MKACHLPTKIFLFCESDYYSNDYETAQMLIKVVVESKLTCIHLKHLFAE